MYIIAKPFIELSARVVYLLSCTYIGKHTQREALSDASRVMKPRLSVHEGHRGVKSLS